MDLLPKPLAQLLPAVVLGLDPLLLVILYLILITPQLLFLVVLFACQNREPAMTAT